MKEAKRYKGMQSFGIGVLLLGATAVLSLLRSSMLLMTVFCAVAAVGEFLMATGALGAKKYAKAFGIGGVLLMLAAICRTVGPLLHVSKSSGVSEGMALTATVIAGLAAILDIFGVWEVMDGCLRVAKERKLNRSLISLAMVLYPVTMLLGQLLPVLLAVRAAGDRSAVLSGITLATILCFLISFLTAAASQGAFRKIEVDYEQTPGTRRHVERPVGRRSGKPLKQ